MKKRCTDVAMRLARPICITCTRPHSTCICHWVRPQSTAVEVIILQHPLEENHAKGTGRLLHLSLSGSILLVSETLNESALETITQPDRQALLLYPQTDANDAPDTSNATATQPALDTLIARSGKYLRLIVLDATWRKSRKMLHLNSALQALPRLSLRDPPPSRYAIRKAQQTHQRSTFEATCAALLQLGESPEVISALLDAFDGFVAQQKSFLPLS